MQQLTISALCSVTFGASSMSTAGIVLTINATDAEGVGAIIRTIVFQDTSKGLKFWPNLMCPAEDQHDFRVHENANRGATEKHDRVVAGPGSDGHLGPGETGKLESSNGVERPENNAIALGGMP